MRKTKKTQKKDIKAKPHNSTEYNRKAQWKAYQELQARADKAWEKLRQHVKKNAQSDILWKDRNDLLLLLGECNYMARECMRMANRSKKKG